MTLAEVLVFVSGKIKNKQKKILGKKDDFSLIAEELEIKVRLSRRW